MNNQKTIINKFGGAIMGSADLLLLSLQQIEKQIKEDKHPVIVISALKDITKHLANTIDQVYRYYFDKNIKTAEKSINKTIKKIRQMHLKIINNIPIKKKRKKYLIKEVDALILKMQKDFEEIIALTKLDYLYARILAYGEKLSSTIFNSLLKEKGIDSILLTGEELGILTDNHFLNASINLKKTTENVLSCLKKYHQVPVITGFIGKNEKGETTTLTRGGSDTTACVLGCILKAEKIILWKEVKGVLSADPRVDKNAVTLPIISYHKAQKVGKVICPEAVEFLHLFKIPTEVTCLSKPKIKTIIGKQEMKGKK